MPPRNLSLVPPATPDQHISVEQLRQYAAGTLLPAQQHLVEAHTIDCAYCGEILDGLSATDYATTETALRTVQGRLHARLAIDAARHSHRYAAWAGAAATLLLLVAAASVFWLNSLPSKARRSPVANTAVPRATPGAASAEAAALVDAATAPAAAAGAVAASTSAAAPQVVAREMVKPTLRQAASPLSGSAGSSGTMATTAVVTSSTPSQPTAATSALPSSASLPIASAVTPTPTPAARVAESPAAAAPTREAPAVAVLAMAPRATASLLAQALPVPTVEEVKLPAEALASAKTQPKEAALATAKASAIAKPTAAGEGRSTMQMPPSPDLASVPSGGHAAFRRYLKKELKFPEADRAKGVEGVVKLRFMVAADGSLQDIKVASPLSEACDAEAIRLLKEGPAWYPAIVRGKRVPTVMRVSVTFNPLE